MNLLGLQTEKQFFTWDVVVAWRDNVFNADFMNCTKSNYFVAMYKLIDTGIIDVMKPLNDLDDDWLENAKKEISKLKTWSTATKKVRASCLNSFYIFLKQDFDTKVSPFRSHPTSIQIKYMLSNVRDVHLTEDIPPDRLCNELSKINVRDSYIVWLMMNTGRPLRDILNLPKINAEDVSPYILNTYTPKHILGEIMNLSKNSKVYLFETFSGKRVNRTQIMRNLKQAGHNIDLGFDLTPVVLHGYVCAYMSRDKRSVIEKAFGF